MTDRELLERAARAAGVCLHPEDKLHRSYGNWGCDTTCMVCKKDPSTATFRPLTDDGDALRLAVKLNLNVFIGREATGVNDGEVPTRKFPSAVESHDEDKYAATRRAIVRAAAAMAPEEAE